MFVLNNVAQILLGKGFHMNIKNHQNTLEQRRSELVKLTDGLLVSQNTKKAIQQDIESHTAFARDTEQLNINRLKNTEAKLAGQIADQKINETTLEQRRNKLITRKTGYLKFWSFFSEEQKEIRKKVKGLDEAIALIKQNLKTQKEVKQTTQESISSIQQHILEYEQFDLGSARTLLASTAAEIQRTQSKITIAKAELDRLEEKLLPHTRQLGRLKFEHATFKSEMNAAERFDQSLSSAKNSYDKAMIHQECEATLGDGSPRKIINDRRGKIRHLENNIPKIERRIQDELKKLDREINHLVIDGNNICYEGNSFIGLRGLLGLLKALNNRFKITVVFDASIRALLKIDNQGVNKALGPSVNAHITPTKTAADEYLLKIAEKKKDTYILSNDRFKEYHDYEVVKSDRVLRFLIADEKLMANDLNLTVKI